MEHRLPEQIRAVITVGSNFDLTIDTFIKFQEKLKDDYKGGAYFVDFMFSHIDYAEDFNEFMNESGCFRKEEVKLKYLDWVIGKTIPGGHQDVAWVVIVVHRKNFNNFYQKVSEYVYQRKVAFTPIYAD